MWTRQEIKLNAKNSLRNFYWKAVLAAFILMLVGDTLVATANSNSFGSSDDTSYVTGSYTDAYGNVYSYGEQVTDGAAISDSLLNAYASLFSLMLPVAVIATLIGLAIKVFVFNPLIVGGRKFFLQASRGDVNLRYFGSAFGDGYMNVVGAMFMTKLSIFLWSLLLVVPGIIKAYEYRMVPYLMIEDPTLSPSQAKELSKNMMLNEKLDVFVLDLTFILWRLLSGITFGIVGIFYVNPYIEFTNAELYRKIRVKILPPEDNFGSYDNGSYNNGTYNGNNGNGNYDNGNDGNGYNSGYGQGNGNNAWNSFN